MTPEQEAREEIDGLLRAAGWCIQNHNEMNLAESAGIAVREFPLVGGFADYLLFVDGQAVGVLEAKARGITLGGVSEQTDKYLNSVPENVPHICDPLPFGYESTGVETFFRDLREPDSRSRRAFAFHKPETLQGWLSQQDTLRARLRDMPPLITDTLWDCQIEAVTNLEKSFAESRPRALIQMATGSGKTYTAISFIYRLIKFANAKRVLFLVDRSNLGKQTRREFQQYVTPDDGRKFTELYNVQHLTSNTIDPVNRVCITTIQRLYSMLKGDPEFDVELEEKSSFDDSAAEARVQEAEYSNHIPIETFDFIVTDECHRSIYNLWRQVLDYFDAFTIGLTATPSKQTLGFFNQNLVTEYRHERAVADGVNVGYEVYRIKTDITEHGSVIDAGYHVKKRDKLTRETLWEQLDEDMEYSASELDRNIVAVDQIRTIIKTFREKLFTEIFPNRTEVPKTLIFAKDDSHAEDITHIVREEFGKGNEFCKKITYRTMGEKTEDLIASFRNAYFPRIAVTVDMISTGTDIKPLECLIFMRDVKSRVYFEQMKGRGTRIIPSDDLRGVTPDAYSKTHFVIVDAVGVCEHDMTDSKPLEHKKSVPFDRLITSVSQGVNDAETLASLAGRLARLDREIDDSSRQEIEQAAQGSNLKQMINALLDAVDPDKHLDRARHMFNTSTPTQEQIAQAARQLIDHACAPFQHRKLVDRIIEIKHRSEQIIDTVSIDEVTIAGYDKTAKERAKGVVNSFKQFIADNKDELTALQIIYSMPYGSRHLTYTEIRQLAGAIETPPYGLTSELLWQAYEKLDESKVKRSGPQKLLTDMISLVRFAIGKSHILEPFSDTVERRFSDWIEQQANVGRTFTPEQTEWLSMIKDQIVTSLSIEMDDFDYAPFNQKGGRGKVHQIFGDDLVNVLAELNEVLAA